MRLGDGFAPGDWSVSRRVWVVRFGRARLSLEAFGRTNVPFVGESKMIRYHGLPVQLDSSGARGVTIPLPRYK